MKARKKRSSRPKRAPKRIAKRRPLPLSMATYLLSAASLIAAGAMIYVLVELFSAS